MNGRTQWFPVWLLFLCLSHVSLLGAEENESASDAEIESDEKIEIPELTLNSLTGQTFTAQYQYRIAAPDGKSIYHRWWLDAGEQPTAIMFLGGRIPATYFSGDKAKIVTANGVKTINSFAWSYALDAKNPQNPFVDFEGANIADENHIYLDVNGFIESFTGDGAPEKFVHPSSRSLKIVSQDKAIQYVQMRTPNDSIRLGYPLQRWHCVDALGELHLEACTVGSSKDQFLKFSLNDILKEENSQELSELPDMSAETFQGAIAETALQALSEIPTSWDNAELKYDFAEMEEYLFPDLLQGNDISEWLRRFRRYCKAVNETVSTDESSLLPIDDPAVCWTRAEMILGRIPMLIAVSVFPAMLNAELFSEQQSIEFIDAFLDLGRCQNAFISGLIKDPKLRDIHEAMRKGRHNSMIGPKGIALCLKHLADQPAGSPSALALTKPLVLAGEIDRIPSVRMDHWYFGNVILGNRFDQLEALRQLTITQAGRRWLRARIENNMKDPIEKKQLALAILKERLEATMKTEQWYFMSQKECKATRVFIDAQHQ